jgi:hypothetical protein
MDARTVLNAKDPAREMLIKDRRGRRIQSSCRLFFFGVDDFEGEATLRNLSTNGCQAWSLTELQVGMTLTLSLFLGDHPWPLRVEEAMVRWVDGQDFGLEFVKLRPAQRDRLRALLMKVKA